MFSKKSTARESPRQQRYLDYIGQFSTDVRYITGESNTVADVMSRINEIEVPNNISLQEIAEEQSEDEELQQLLETNTHSLKLQKTNFQGLQLVFDTSTNNMRPYIPKKIQRKFFDSIHNMSHQGKGATLKTISQRGVWKNMKSDCNSWTKTCISCQRSKVSKHTRSPIVVMNTPEAKFCELNMDIIGPYSLSEGMKYCLTIIDRFSRWVEAIPIPDISAQTIIRTFYDQWICRYGTPTKIITDQGRQFMSRDFELFCKKFGILHARTTAYNPKCNGLVERFHRTLKSAIKAHYPQQWTKCLSTVLFGLRTTVRENSNYSIAEMLYGKPLRLPSDFFMTIKMT
jgi:cleavage and polyadenylation specificity factor subunit 1